MKLELIKGLKNVFWLLERWKGKKIEVDETDLNHPEGKARLKNQLKQTLAEVIKKLNSHPRPKIVARLLEGMVKRIVGKLER